MDPEEYRTQVCCGSLFGKVRSLDVEVEAKLSTVSVLWAFWTVISGIDCLSSGGVQS